MRRVLVGVIWFVVLSSLGLAAMAGAKANYKVHAVRSSDGFSRVMGAGSEMADKYGTVILLGALVLSLAGTATGSLPGARRREAVSGPLSARQ